jgi:hypothetical protein
VSPFEQYLNSNLRTTPWQLPSVEQKVIYLRHPTTKKELSWRSVLNLGMGVSKGTSVMHEGIMNEEPTTNAFSLEPMVVELYEVGGCCSAMTFLSSPFRLMVLQ